MSLLQVSSLPLPVPSLISVALWVDPRAGLELVGPASATLHWRGDAEAVGFRIRCLASPSQVAQDRSHRSDCVAHIVCGAAVGTLRFNIKWPTPAKARAVQLYIVGDFANGGSSFVDKQQACRGHDDGTAADLRMFDVGVLCVSACSRACACVL